MNLMGLLLLAVLLEPSRPKRVDQYDKEQPFRKKIGPFDMEEVYKGYAVAAIWTSLDERDNEHEHIDDTCSIYDITDETRDKMWRDCEKFVEDNFDDLAASGLSPEYIGHNFWLNRNGHGVGFWDRGLGELGKKLDRACGPWGEYNLFINDCGEVEAM